MPMHKREATVRAFEPLEGRLCLNAGALDSAFANATSTLSASNADYAQAIAPQADGKFVVAGQSDGAVQFGIGVGRFIRDGSFDSGFAQLGQTFIPLSQPAYVSGVAIQSDGKIIVAGASGGDFILLRLLSNGNLDDSFGNHGLVRTDFAGKNDALFALTLRPDGRILVGGATGDSNMDVDFALAQFKSDGTLDPSFGVAGKSVLKATRKHDEIRSISLQKDGKIIVGGSSFKSWTVARLTASGQFDATFGNGGISTAALPAPLSSARVVRAMKDGSILAAGSSANQFAAIHLKGDGALDQSFGMSGIARVDFGYSYAELADAVIQKGGKIILVGSAGNLNGGKSADQRIDFALTRINIDGSRDRSFGHLGRATLSFYRTADIAAAATITGYGTLVVVGSHQSAPSFDPIDFEIAGLAPNGELVQSPDNFGRTTSDFTSFGKTTAISVVPLAANDLEVLSSDSDGFNEQFALSHYTQNGRLDTDLDLGIQGTTFINFGGQINHPTAMAVRSDEVIAVAGYAHGGKFGGNTAAVVALLTLFGTPVSNFGDQGQVSFMLPDDYAFINAVAFHENKVLVAGGLESGAFFMMQFDQFGHLDQSFGAGGIVKTQFLSSDLSVLSSTAASAIAIQGDGKILLAGTAGKITDIGNLSEDVFAVARYTVDGQSDPTFGSGGKVSVSIGAQKFEDVAKSIALQPDGKIVVAGRSLTSIDPRFPTASDMSVIRLNTNGSLDRSFSGDGKATVDFGPYLDGASRALIQSDGKILLAGQTRTNAPSGGLPNTDFALARLKPDGSLDSTFGVGGKVITNFGVDDEIADIALNSAGQIMAAGNSDSSIALARYNNDPVGIQAQIIGDTLIVTGTPGDDQIVFGHDFNQSLTITGTSFKSQASFSKIQIRAMGGNDRILSSITPSGHIIPETIDGGDGDDFLVGGPGNDLLQGGQGFDLLFSNDGDDTLFGDNGDDALYGGDGNDYLNGGSGSDQIYGENGNDQIFARDNTIDQIYGGDGFDRAQDDLIDQLTQVEAVLA